MKKIKRIASLLLTLMCIFALADISAYAVPPGNPHIDSGSAADGGNLFEFDASYLGETGWRDLKTPPHWVVETGEVAYCLDHKAESPNNDTYQEFNPKTIYSDKTYMGLLAIMEHSYPYRNAGLTDQQIIYATANAIRSWLMESEDIGYEFMLPANKAVRPKNSTAQSTYNFYLQLLDKARSGSIVNHRISITPDVVELELVDGRLQGTVTVEYSALNGKYVVAESKLSPGMSVSGYTGNSGDILTFTIPIGIVGRTINLTDILIGYDNRCEENIVWLDDMGSKQAVAVPVADRMCEVCKATITFKTDPAHLIITKKDSITGEVLKGAKFGIYIDGDVLIEEITTDSNGKAVSGNLVFRDYYVKELEPPEGYILSDEVYNFTIDSIGQQVLFDVVNEPSKGKISITKIGENEERLQGAVFEIYDSSDNLVERVTTDEQGTALSDYLYYGDYYIRELAAPEGYVQSDDLIPFSIKENDEVVYITVSNRMIRGKVQITLIDEEGNLLEGAIYGIYTKDGEMVEELQTDAQGEAVSADLRYGTYYVKEIQAPVGYVIDDTPIQIAIAEDGQVVYIDTVNKKMRGTLQIHVKGSENHEPVSGVVCELYNSDDELIETLISDEEGLAKSGYLGFGQYYVKQTVTKEGYLLNQKIFDFSIANDREVVELEIVNEPIKGKVEIINIEPINSKPLAGIKYGIYDSQDNLLEEFVTRENGTAVSSKLNYGEYYIKQIKSIKGYIKNDSVYSLCIRENDETVQIWIKSIPMSGCIEVCYLDLNDGHELHKPYTYCDWIGLSNVEWIQDKEVDDIKIEGYSITKVDYPNNTFLTDTKQIITYWYDRNVKQGEWKGVYIPKTGQKFPYLSYLGGIFCFMIAIVLIGLSHVSVKRGDKS